ncbi:MAG: Maf family protein [Planctomycetota bacterium]
MTQVPLHLASASPRRRLLLEEAGFTPDVISSGIDDAELRPKAVPPVHWAASLAYLKARGGLRFTKAGIVLGADTIVDKAGDIIGQPRDADHARNTILQLSGGSHSVISGVALLWRDEKGTVQRSIFADTSTVHVGALPSDAIEAYIDSGDWRGKAGGYNLSERIEAGWPITFDGDPATVMGLPMQRLIPMLEILRCARQETSAS